MPILNGIDTLRMVKERFAEFNQKNRQVVAIRPCICFLSQYDEQTMMQFISDEEQADFFLEKPLPFKQLVSLLRILGILV